MSTLQNYKRKLSTFGSQNIHILPWGYVLLKNVFENGKLGKNSKQNSLLTYLPHPNWDKKKYDNLIGISDLPPLQNLRQISAETFGLLHTSFTLIKGQIS